MSKNATATENRIDKRTRRAQWEGWCKHMRALEAQSSVMQAASAGGEVTSEEGRPADCACLASFEELPCWPCYRDGFETPNPEVEG